MNVLFRNSTSTDCGSATATTLINSLLWGENTDLTCLCQIYFIKSITFYFLLYHYLILQNDLDGLNYLMDIDLSVS